VTEICKKNHRNTHTNGKTEAKEEVNKGRMNNIERMVGNKHK
jgi:hypothetical protein